MGYIPTGTWPTPQNMKQPLFKIRIRDVLTPSIKEGLMKLTA